MQLRWDVTLPFLTDLFSVYNGYVSSLCTLLVKCFDFGSLFGVLVCYFNLPPAFFVLQDSGGSEWTETTWKMVLSEPYWDHHIPLPKLGPLHSRLVTAFVALICFINSYDGDFVFDDSEAIINNKVLTPPKALVT